MHRTTDDRPLTGVHWLIHRSWCRGSGTKGDLSTSTDDVHRRAGWRTKAAVYITTRDLDRIDDLSTGAVLRPRLRLLHFPTAVN